MGALLYCEAECLSQLDEGNLVGTGGLELFVGAVLVEDWSDVVAECKRDYDVSEALILGTSTLWHQFCALEYGDDFVVLLVGEFCLIVDGDLSEEHVVLGEGAGLVREDVLDPAQFLGTVAVPGNCPCDVFVLVDEVSIEQLGEV